MGSRRRRAEPERVRVAVARAAGLGSDRVPRSVQVREMVQVRETHISWVFLVGDRAYKLKKPLVLPFLDYGTPAKRRRMCREEVRLNRRLAPDVYIGVRALATAGEDLELADEADPRAVDYVVEMRRYDEGRTLAATLDRGELRRGEVDAVARVLADFHAGCPRVPQRPDPVHAAQHEIDANFAEILLLAELRVERERVLAMWRFASAFIAARADVFDARARQGCLRDCHGDLRAEHVLLGGTPAVVDCVEFEQLRALDVADDLAFLVMDLTALGGDRFADELVASYRRAGGDPGDDALLAFYACYRALGRAKVLLARAAQLPSGSAAHGHASAQARDLVAVAERFGWRARLPLLIVVCGVPASGKSHVSAALAAASGLAHLSSGVTRKRLDGLEPAEPASPEHYSADFSRATYAELGQRAAAEIGRRGGALVDATFRRRADRDAFAHAFGAVAPVVFVECRTPVHLLVQRAIRRERGELHVSGATLPVVLHERAAWEALDEVPAEDHFILRCDRPVERVVAELVDLLDARLRP